jgi:hypothetical protein
MIEERFLPMRRSNSIFTQRLRDGILQRLHPSGDRYFLIIRCNEYMQMIWHNDVRADPSMQRAFFPKTQKSSWIAGVARMLRRFCVQAVTK